MAFGRDVGEAFRVLSRAKDSPSASQGSQKTQISAGHDRIGDSRIGDEEHTNAQRRTSNVQRPMTNGRGQRAEGKGAER